MEWLVITTIMSFTREHPDYRGYTIHYKTNGSIPICPFTVSSKSFVYLPSLVLKSSLLSNVNLGNLFLQHGLIDTIPPTNNLYQEILNYVKSLL